LWKKICEGPFQAAAKRADSALVQSEKLIQGPGRRHHEKSEGVKMSSPHDVRRKAELHIIFSCGKTGGFCPFMKVGALAPPSLPVMRAGMGNNLCGLISKNGCDLPGLHGNNHKLQFNIVL
jgi:hypothetical protein